MAVQVLTLYFNTYILQSLSVLHFSNRAYRDQGAHGSFVLLRIWIRTVLSSEHNRGRTISLSIFVVM